MTVILNMIIFALSFLATAYCAIRLDQVLPPFQKSRDSRRFADWMPLWVFSHFLAIFQWPNLPSSLKALVLFAALAQVGLILSSVFLVNYLVFG